MSAELPHLPSRAAPRSSRFGTGFKANTSRYPAPTSASTTCRARRRRKTRRSRLPLAWLYLLLMVGTIAASFTAAQVLLPGQPQPDIRYPDGSGIGA